MTHKRGDLVVVLGCGPAGLMAAHAVYLAGHEMKIISRKRKSEMYGAQYLHQPIPDTVREEPFDVSYTLQGTVDEYRRKVYGPNYRGEVSPEELGQPHKGWNIRATYDSLWRRYGDSIVHVEDLRHKDVKRIQRELDPLAIFNTIPMPLLCKRPEEHSFTRQQVYAIGDAPERGTFCPVQAAPMNSVVCNGERDVSWYRAANILGYRTAEWSMDDPPPYSGIAAVTKPLKTNCKCLKGMIRLGRYGQWKKGVLSHTAFNEAMEVLA